MIRPTRAARRNSVLMLQQPLIMVCAALGMLIMYLMREVQKLGQDMTALQQILGQTVVSKSVAPAAANAQQASIVRPMPEKKVFVAFPDTANVISLEQSSPLPSPVVHEEMEEVDGEAEVKRTDDVTDDEIVEALTRPPSPKEVSRKKMHRSRKHDASKNES